MNKSARQALDHLEREFRQHDKDRELLNRVRQLVGLAPAPAATRKAQRVNHLALVDRVVKTVRALKGGARVGELVDRLRVPKPAVSRALAAARADGALKLQGVKRLSRWVSA